MYAGFGDNHRSERQLRLRMRTDDGEHHLSNFVRPWTILRPC